MKKQNIIKKLEKEGYRVVGAKFDYWQVAAVELENGGILRLADGYTSNGSYGVIENFKYADVKNAIFAAENNGYYREDCKIFSMADYFYFLQNGNDRVEI